MTYSFARRNAGEYNNFRVIFCLLGLIFLIGVILMSQNFYYNALRGPFDVTPRDILELQTLDGLTEYYVRIKVRTVYDTGYSYVDHNFGIETRHDSFIALRLEDRFLLVKVPGDPDNSSTYTGTLTALDSEVQREVVDKVIAEEPALKGRFLPYMMETTADLRINGIISILLVAVLIVGLIWMLARSFMTMTNFSGKPLLAAHPRIGDEKEVLAQASSELNQRHIKIAREFHLTKNWLVQNSSAYLSLMRTSDVVWVYTNAIDYQPSNSYRSRKIDLATIYDRYGNKLVLTGNKKQVQDIIDKVVERAPWAVKGYKPDWEKLWDEDRNKFIQAVDRRRVLMHTG
jgi:hypothetical protein